MTVDQLITKLQEIRDTQDSRGVTKGEYEINLFSLDYDPSNEIFSVVTNDAFKWVCILQRSE
jgi:hypothetical protein